MAFTVVYDANVLFPAPLRDLLIRLGQTDVLRARWTDRILDETFGSILRQRPELTPKQLARTRELMCQAVRDCLVTGYETLVPALSLPDPDDRHVLAAAVRCGAQAIVTSNTKDFPAKILEPLGIEAQTPDEFVLALVELAPEVVWAVVERQAAALRNPPRTLDDLLGTLENNGLVRSVAALKGHRASRPSEGDDEDPGAP